MIRSLFIQLLIFIVIFNALSWFKASSMLAKHTHVPLESPTLNTLMGDDIQLVAKDKETVIYFFAPWCNICHLSIENLEEFFKENKNINVIAVALDFVDINEVKSFVKQHQLTFPIALGNEETKHIFRISGYPSYYVIDKNNTIISKSLGYSSKMGIKLRTL